MQFVEILPLQKLPENKKNKDWHISCVEQGLALINSYDSLRRTSRYNKKINYDLVSNIFHTEDLMYVLNPLGLEENTVPAELRHYDIITPKIHLLYGEESARIFNFIVRSINEDAISEKEQVMKDMLFQFIQQAISGKVESMNIQDEEQKSKVLDQEMARIKRFMNYSYQDVRERSASHIINFLRRKLDVDKLFLDGWEDALVAGEEIYRVDIVGGEPVVERCNPLEMFYLLPHNSYYIDESELIVEDTWMSKARIIDEFYDELTEDEVSQIEESSSWTMAGNSLNYVNPVILHTSDIPVIDSVNQLNDHNSTIDSKGNIRVTRVTWKSRRKVGIVRYLHPVTGEMEETVVNESFKPSEEQDVEWIWINEYRQGIKIGPSIYVKLGPCRLQRRDIDNLSSCKSPYIGTIYGGNNSQSASIIDRLKPYQYLYNIMMFRIELALARSYGKVMEFDVASIPREYGFDIDKWLYYLSNMGIAFKNSFEEHKKGETVGMMSGAQAATRAIDLEQGQYINQHIQLLSFIEERVAQISGVTQQRQGNVGERELVGNVQQSILQSNYITEKYFSIHNGVKKRVLEALLDTAKSAWRGKKKRLQYVTDDLGINFLTIDGDDFDSAEYGLFVTNSVKDNQALDAMKRMMDVALQTDKINYSQLIDIMLTESINDTKRKIENFEMERAEREQQQFQAEQEAAERDRQLVELKMERDYELEKYKIDQDNETRLQVAELQALGRASQGGETDTSGLIIKEAELSLKEREASQKASSERMSALEKQMERAANERLKREELRLKEKEIASKEKIEKMKADTALRVAKENKNRFDKKTKK